MATETTQEFSHTVPLSEIGGKVVHRTLVADAGQRAALARRFGLLSLDKLTAQLALSGEGEAIILTGNLAAELTQACVASGVPVPDRIDERFNIRFIAAVEYAPDAEIELGADDCDTVFHNGKMIDLGEAVAETLGLSINPYPRTAEAEAVLTSAGVKDEGAFGPFAALAALKKGTD